MEHGADKEMRARTGRWNMKGTYERMDRVPGRLWPSASRRLSCGRFISLKHGSIIRGASGRAAAMHTSAPTSTCRLVGKVDAPAGSAACAAHSTGNAPSTREWEVLGLEAVCSARSSKVVASSPRPEIISRTDRATISAYVVVVAGTGLEKTTRYVVMNLQGSRALKPRLIRKGSIR